MEKLKHFKLPLVSIVTPCLNGEKYVDRFLDSILAQTYSTIELIFVNDGSTDKTEEIVLSYKQKFEERGIGLKYIYQENQGLGGAINTGLKHVTGDYLCWPDSDDYLEPDSVAKRVEVLDNNQVFAIVTSDSYYWDADKPEKPLGVVSQHFSQNNNENQFELLLRGDSILNSGTHMVRVDAFFETHQNGQIYPCRRGQNWQMLLPLYYKHKRYFLNEPLYNYIIYQGSMSRDSQTLDKKIERFKEHEDIIIHTLKSMAIDFKEKERYISETKIRYAQKIMILALKNWKLKLFFNQYNFLRVNQAYNINDLLGFIGKMLKK